VWKIDEGPDKENKSQITGKIEIAIQIVGYTETYHPRICWHSHKQVKAHLHDLWRFSCLVSFSYTDPCNFGLTGDSVCWNWELHLKD
jgi:hypothetical protein